VNPTLGDLERETVVHGFMARYWAHNPTPGVSIKTMTNGRGLYRIDGGIFAVDEAHYLILNHQQPYTIEIDSPTMVESFCVFIPTAWTIDVDYALQTNVAHLLETPQPKGTPPSFFERLYPHDRLISPVMDSLRTRLADRTTSYGWLEETLRDLYRRMLHTQGLIANEIAGIDAARLSTRVELYKRLHRARDYMHAYLDHPITIEDMAAVAYLSPYHFLRAFRAAFGLTPHAYLVRQRITWAKFLLRRTHQPITDICFAVGFEGLGSFSRLFRRLTGLSPREYRNFGEVSLPFHQYNSLHITNEEANR
jgi:AraC-like DNA-binding protein